MKRSKKAFVRHNGRSSANHRLKNVWSHLLACPNSGVACLVIIIDSTKTRKRSFWFSSSSPAKFLGRKRKIIHMVSRKRSLQLDGTPTKMAWMNRMLQECNQCLSDVSNQLENFENRFRKKPKEKKPKNINFLALFLSEKLQNVRINNEKDLQLGIEQKEHHQSFREVTLITLISHGILQSCWEILSRVPIKWLIREERPMRMRLENKMDFTHYGELNKCSDKNKDSILQKAIKS